MTLEYQAKHGAGNLPSPCFTSELTSGSRPLAAIETVVFAGKKGYSFWKLDREASLFNEKYIQVSACLSKFLNE